MRIPRQSLFALAGLAVTVTIAVPATAQLGRPTQGQGRGNQTRKPAARNYLPELKTIAEEMSKQYSTKIVVDPGLFVATKPTAPEAGLTIDKAMDTIALAAKDLSWRRVYFSQTQGNVVPAPEKLVESVRALDKLEQSGMVMENPLTKKATTYLKDWSVSPNFKEELTAGQFSATPVFVLYSTKVGAKNAQEELADMQRRSMELMMSMDPDQMAEAMNAGVNMFMNLDPDTRGRFMAMQMQAGMRMFQSMTPDQRNQMAQQAMQMMQGLGGPGGAGAPAGGGGGRRP